MLNDYETYKTQMKTGDCLLFSGRSLVSAGIKAFTKSPWSHAALIIRLSEYEGEERHRFFVEATSPKVKLTRLSAFMEEYTGMIAWLPLPDVYDADRTKYGHMMLEQLDKKYDYKSLFKQAFRRVSTDADKLFCSELCGYIWSLGGKYAPRPADIPKEPVFTRAGIQPVVFYDGGTL